MLTGTAGDIKIAGVPTTTTIYKSGTLVVHGWYGVGECVWKAYGGSREQYTIYTLIAANTQQSTSMVVPSRKWVCERCIIN
jgi:hypothetical protein